MKVSADFEQIRHALESVIRNGAEAAVRFEKDGRVSVAVCSTEDTVAILVTNTGAAIPEEEQSKMFDPFFTTKRVGEGTGLGLCVAHGIVEQHNGRLFLKSSANGKTVFELRIPMISEDPGDGAERRSKGEQ